MKRTPLHRKAPMKQCSDKRKDFWQSREGRMAVQYMQAVKMLPCCITGKAGPNDSHHPICSRYGSRKSSPWDVIPLCKAMHQEGPEAIHNGKAAWAEKHGPDTDYIAQTRAAVKALYPGLFDEWL